MTCPSTEGWDSDGSLSWEEFFGSNNTEDLESSIVGMYDALVGRGATTPNTKPPPSPTWSSKVTRRWNCRCRDKAASLVVTRCASCIADVRSTDIRDSLILDSNSPPPQRRASVGCPNGASGLFNLEAAPAPELAHLIKHPTTPSKSPLLASTRCNILPENKTNRNSAPGTPTLSRPAVSPLALKRLRAEGNVSRPLSVTSITSSLSSSSSAGSSCSHRIPHKSAYLASIESLEDPTVKERRKCEKNRSEWFKCDDSQGSADSGVHSSCSTSPSRPRYCDPNLSYMDRVVMEIIETEQIYVRDLRSITEGYLNYWRSQPDFPLMDRLSDLFGNLEDIYHFNSDFLKDLEQCGLDPVKVARSFVRNNVGFSVYTDYCTNYPRTVSSLTELMRQEGAVRLFRERQTALQQSLPLGSYLLKPVQRILKYHLLLQNIVKQSVTDMVGYADIEDALAAMTGIAQHINDMKRRHEHAVRVQEIQSLLYGWEGEDLTTFGELCAEGSFRMSGAKALRHIFLFDKILIITKKKDEGVLAFKAHINCSNLMLIESVPGEPLSFHVIPFDNPRLQYTLQAKNLEQKREWTLQIKRVILENYNAVIPTHARQLVMELGQIRTDDEIMTERSAPKRQHSAPEYLERRKDRRKSDGFRARLRRTRKSDVGSTQDGQTKTNDKKSSDQQRRQSEPLPLPVNNSFINESSTTDNESFPISADSPDKVSIDLENVEEVETIEQIVGQLLMQNREFEKVLKRQKHQVSLRNRKKNIDIASTTDDDDEEGIYETLLNVKLVLAGENADESEYVTLIRENSLKRPNSVDCKDSLKFLEPVTSMEKMSIPTLPSVWLQQQGQHLATPSKKAGSLPRSFQMTIEGADDAFKDARSLIERPFTIASDQPNPILYDERYCRRFPLPGECAIEDESLTEMGSTPGASLDRIDMHPDYRIYRSGVSASVLKHAIASVGSKLAHLKVDLSSKSLDDNKVMQWEQKATRLVYLLARQCRKKIKSHLKQGSHSFDALNTPQQPSVFKQGSSNLGARIANSNPKLERIRPKAAAFLGLEPDYFISMSSSMCSVTENTPTSGSVSSSVIDDDDDESDDVSVDSFYERSFEAIDDELLKHDSTFSDLEEETLTDDEPSLINVEVEKTEDLGHATDDDDVQPLPLPTDDQDEEEKVVRGVEEAVFKRSKSIRERQRDLEMWRLRKEEEDSSHQQINIDVEGNTDETRPKGWVRHIVGKLQAGDIKTETSIMFKT